MKIRWLDELNRYGIKPSRLIIIIKINRVVIIELYPLIFIIVVRLSCDIIKVVIGLSEFIFRDIFTQIEDEIINKINVLIDKNIEFSGINELYANESKDEKMSGIITRSSL